MILNKKGNILIVVVIPIAIFLVVGGIYLYQQSVKTNEMLQNVREKEGDLDLTEEVIVETEKIEQEGIVELLEKATSEDDKNPLKKEEETSTEKELSNEEIIKNAFYATGSASCTLSEELFGRENQIYIKKGNFLIKEKKDGHAFYPAATFFDLYKNGFYYSWDDSKSEGEVFSLGQGPAPSAEELNFFIDNIASPENVKKCSNQLISDNLFVIPSEITFFDGLKSITDQLITNQLGQIRSLMEMHYSLGYGYYGYKEAAEAIKNIDHPDNNLYQEIKDKIKESGGELIVKFSKDFNDEEGYSDFCAYSKLNLGEDNWAYCVDSTGNSQKHNTLKFNCFTGVAVNCK